MYAVAVINTRIHRGSTFREKFTWNTGTPSCYSPVNLTGCQTWGAIRDDSGAVVRSLSQNDGSLILGGTDGAVTILLPHTETAAWSRESTTYEVYIQMTNGDVVKKYKGTIYCDLEE